ncbi:MAG: CerR family C-terminal domain-containing protein [Lentisphaerae bacterium]|nr:CerR family C-terminal domain-containing protein [Lentisphaerota bacterium]
MNEHVTKQRVLEAAGKVFARDGYRDATVQKICAEAGANIAAINYHFQGKSNLYLAVWEYLCGIVHQEYFDRIQEVADPVERLRETIFQRVRHAFDTGPAGQLRSIIHSEMGDPTEVHLEVKRRFLQPLMGRIADTVAAVLGVDPDDPTARRCAFSLHSQLISLTRLNTNPNSPFIRRLMGSNDPASEQIDELSEHLFVFVMGGIRAVSEQPRKLQHRGSLS